MGVLGTGRAAGAGNCIAYSPNTTGTRCEPHRSTRHRPGKTPALRNAVTPLRPGNQTWVWRKPVSRCRRSATAATAGGATSSLFPGVRARRAPNRDHVGQAMSAAFPCGDFPRVKRSRRNRRDPGSKPRGTAALFRPGNRSSNSRAPVARGARPEWIGIQSWALRSAVPLLRPGTKLRDGAHDRPCIGRGVAPTLGSRAMADGRPPRNASLTEKSS